MSRFPDTEPPCQPRVGAIILCGGRSSRMGQSKAWLPFHGEVSLQRVVRVVSSILGPVVVVAAPAQPVPALPHGTLLVRDHQEGCGPLGGFSAGLAALRGRCEWIYLGSCDSPLLQASFLAGLVSSIPFEPAGVVVPEVRGRLHPLAAIYSQAVEAIVNLRLEAGLLRMTELIEQLPARRVTEDELRRFDPTLRSLRNLNTPEDYAAALAEWENPPESTGS